MKKAKEYVEWYNNASDKRKATSDIVMSLLDEAIELKKQRNVKSDAAFVAILKELSQKWNAMSRRQPDFLEDGFLNFLKHKFPELEQLM
jgi:hypothetical protein